MLTCSEGGVWGEGPGKNSWDVLGAKRCFYDSTGLGPWAGRAAAVIVGETDATRLRL